MATHGAQFTRAGYERLKAELESLRARRQEVIAEVKVTREDGDLRENAGYHAAREAHSIIENQIRVLESKLDGATVLPDDATFDEVEMGVPVTVRYEDTGRVMTCTLVDGAEVDFTDGGISVESPLGEVLLYARVGETVEAETPRGVQRVTVLSIGEEA